MKHFTKWTGFLVLAVMLITGCAGNKPRPIPIDTKTTHPELQEKQVVKSASLKRITKEYIPRTIKALERRKRSDASKQWKKAKVGKKVLEWTYSRTQKKFRAHRWLCAIEKNRRPVGMIGLKADTQELVLRVDQLDPRSFFLMKRFFNIPYAQIKKNMPSMLPKSYQGEYVVDHLKLVQIDANYYYMLAKADREANTYLFIPVEDLTRFYTFAEVLQRNGQFRDAQVGKEEEGGKPQNLVPNNKYDVTLKDTTLMVDEVPRYNQIPTGNCWAYSLAMVHQWWVPRNLGPSDYQTDMLRLSMNKTTQNWAKVKQVHNIMSSWDIIKENWDNNGPARLNADQHHAESGWDSAAGFWANKNWVDNFDYEDFKTTWWGQAREIRADQPIAWKTDDIKTWIAWEAPVVVAVNSDGNGDDSFNHYMVVIGYDDEEDDGMIYFNNTNSGAGSMPYTTFNHDFWHAHYYTGVGYRKRRGLVGGMPGDKKFIEIHEATASVPASIHDGGEGTVANIGIKTKEDTDTSFAGDDMYGDAYNTSAVFNVLGGAVTDVVKGEFDPATAINLAAGSVTFFEQHASQTPGQKVDGGSFKISLHPNAQQASVAVNQLYTVFDEDNRSHFQNQGTINVYEDTPAQDTLFDMLTPKKYAHRIVCPDTVFLSDDDKKGPEFDLLSSNSVSDTQVNDYEFRVKITDLSGIDNARYMYRYNITEPFSEWQNFGSPNGDNYSFTIPRTEWIQNIGKDLIVRVHATDNDKDMWNDQKDDFTTYYIELKDDDADMPEITDTEIEKTATNVTFHVKIADASGVSTSAIKLFHSYNATVAESTNFKVMQPDSSKSSGWYTCQVPIDWIALVGNTDPLPANVPPKFMYYKVNMKDVDNDRLNDAKEGFSIIESVQIVGAQVTIPSNDITWEPESETGEYKEDGIWTYNKNRDPERFYKGPPRNGPIPVPQRMSTRTNRRMVIHYYLDGYSENKSLTFKAEAKEVTGDNYYMSVKNVDAKGKTTLLGVVNFDGRNTVQNITLNKAVTSQGDNQLVLESINIGADQDSELTWKSMSMNEDK
jgi:hypothetical protein